ncbi:MAG: alpha/beta hydrolase [Bdellovibrio sp.]|nr:alpha/beta hydrolase [Bdellovibrio sp.]
MKTKITAILFGLVCVFTFSSIAFAQTGTVEILKYNFDAKYPLYLRDGSKFGFENIDQAMDRAYTAGKPVVLFVHGRGSEPNKSLDKATFVEGGAVRKIEDQYKATVVLFSWDSQAFLFDRTKPLSKMKESADSFALVMMGMNRYFEKHPLLKRPTLIGHSMGSIVLETYVKKYGWFPQATAPVFSKVFFTSPDSDNINHWVWLHEIGRLEKVYLTINKSDGILRNSNNDRDNGAKPLGYRPVLPYSENITYLELTDVAGGAHEVFNKDNMMSQVNYCQIFDRIFHGTDPLITPATTTATSIANYFKVKSLVNKKDICFTNTN